MYVSMIDSALDVNNSYKHTMDEIGLIHIDCTFQSFFVWKLAI